MTGWWTGYGDCVLYILCSEFVPSSGPDVEWRMEKRWHEGCIMGRKGKHLEWVAVNLGQLMRRYIYIYMAVPVYTDKSKSDKRVGARQSSTHLRSSGPYSRPPPS